MHYVVPSINSPKYVDYTIHTIILLHKHTVDQSINVGFMMPRALNSCSFPSIDCDLLPSIIRCIQLSHQSLFAIVIQQNDFRYRWNIFPSGLYENIEYYLSYFKHFQSLIFRRFVTLFWRLLYAIFNVSFPNFHIAIIELHARQRVKYLCCLLHWYAF